MTDNPPATDAGNQGGHSYEASMLRNLLASIHGDGGHYVAEHGLDAALESADQLVAGWRAEVSPPLPQGEKVAEPLFLLHCGQIDSGGEQDEWETEADSGTRVDEFASLHPGQTIGLYPFAPPPPAAQPVALTKAQVRRLYDNSPEAIEAVGRTAFYKIVRLLEEVFGIPRPDGGAGPQASGGEAA